MIYKNRHILPQTYQLADTKKWVARGHIKPVVSNIGTSYRWIKRVFPSQTEADSYVLRQMMMGIDSGEL